MTKPEAQGHTPAHPANYLEDLILALRKHGVPLSALNLDCFTTNEQIWIRAGYETPCSELIEQSWKAA